MIGNIHMPNLNIIKLFLRHFLETKYDDDAESFHTGSVAYLWPVT